RSAESGGPADPGLVHRTERSRPAFRAWAAGASPLSERTLLVLSGRGFGREGLVGKGAPPPSMGTRPNGTPHAAPVGRPAVTGTAARARGRGARRRGTLSLDRHRRDHGGDLFVGRPALDDLQVLVHTPIVAHRPSILVAASRSASPAGTCPSA